jgi:acyl carrier protein
MNNSATALGKGFEENRRDDLHLTANMPGPEQTVDLTATQSSVLQICCEVLKVDRIRLQDDFFDDLGGTSLALINILARITESFGVSVNPSALIDDSTIGRVAECVQDALSPSNC